MMYSYPFYSFPRFKRYPSYYGSNLARPKEPYIAPVCNIKENTKKVAHCDTDKSDKAQKDEDILFEIFGLKLFYDDILLICLIFFLYQEGVEDQYLFIALVLLLLS